MLDVSVHDTSHMTLVIKHVNTVNNVCRHLQAVMLIRSGHNLQSLIETREFRLWNVTNVLGKRLVAGSEQCT